MMMIHGRVLTPRGPAGQVCVWDTATAAADVCLREEHALLVEWGVYGDTLCAACGRWCTAGSCCCCSRLNG